MLGEKVGGEAGEEVVVSRCASDVYFDDAEVDVIVERCRLGLSIGVVVAEVKQPGSVGH